MNYMIDKRLLRLLVFTFLLSWMMPNTGFATETTFSTITANYSVDKTLRASHNETTQTFIHPVSVPQGKRVTATVTWRLRDATAPSNCDFSFRARISPNDGGVWSFFDGSLHYQYIWTFSSDQRLYLELASTPQEYTKTIYGTNPLTGNMYIVGYQYIPYSYWSCSAPYTLTVEYEDVLPDLTISSLSLSQGEAAVDETITLSCSIQNEGLKSADASTAFVYDGDRCIGTIAVDALEPGASVRQTLSLPRLSAGNHEIKIVLDATNELEEGNEQNNSKSVPLFVYERTPYKVRFDANGGTGCMADQSFVCGTEQRLLNCGFSYSGKKFIGWATSADGNTVYKDSQQVKNLTHNSGDIFTLYAVWKDRFIIENGVLVGVDMDGLTSSIIPDSVIAIGANAFENCTNLTEIIIPSSVTNIATCAFLNCSGLKNMTIPGSVAGIGDGAFKNCQGLANPDGFVIIRNVLYSYHGEASDLTLPDGVKHVGYRAFYNCSGLTRVTIPDCVTSIGDEAFSWCSSLRSVTIPDSVTSIGFSAFANCKISEATLPGRQCKIPFGYVTNLVISAGTTHIGDNAFYSCSALKSVTIPDSVTSIGRYAFYGCSSLASVMIPNSVTSIGLYAFYGCSSLASVMIPNSVTSIGLYAFENCSSLVSVTISNGVTSIAIKAFYNCNALESVTIPESVTDIGHNAFTGTPFYNNQPNGLVIFGKVAYKMKGTCPAVLTIPDNVTSIAAEAFYSCNNLIAVTMPNSVKEIGGGAFAECSKLKTMSIPDSVTSIGDYAFSECSSLPSVTIPNGVTSIEKKTFYKCSALKSVTIGDGVTSIGDSAFYGCKAMTGVTIPNRVSSIGEDAFYGCNALTSVTVPNSVTSIGKGAFRYCTSITSATIGESVTNIGDYAFSNCESLTSVTIPNGVTSLGGYVFYDCNSLVGVTIPDSVTSIGAGAFSGTPFYNKQPNGLMVFGKVAYKMKGTSPSVVIIPDGVTRIEKSAFSGCGALASVTIPNSVTSIGKGAFNGCNVSISDTNSISGVQLVDGWVIGRIGSLPERLDLTGARGIGDNALENCSTITSVIIPEGIAGIGVNAFYGCSGLAKAYIPTTYTGTIENNTFPSSTIIFRYKPTQIVIFDAGDGSVGTKNKFVKYGAKYGTLPIPICEGCSFAGWRLNDGEITSDTIVTALDDHTLVAQWKINQYTVTFNANGGSGGTTKTQDYGTALTAPTVTRTGYTFTGWSPAVPSTMPAKSEAYTAQWKINQYTATFDANGGSGGTTKTQNYGTALTAPTVTRTGYTFTGWSPAVPSTMPAKSEVYAAQWKANTYSVTFNANGGSGTMTAQTYTNGAAQALLSNTFTRTGYDFVGWSTGSSATSATYFNGQSITISSSMTLYAVWTLKTYTIRFDANGGDSDSSFSRYYGVTLGPLPTPTMSGYTFAGWWTAASGGTKVTSATTVTADVTYYAHWTANTYSVTFNANGGSGTMTAQIYTNGVAQALLSNTFTRTGYDFAGWSTGSSATSATYFNGQSITISSSMTLYALWTLKTYTIRFDANDGDSDSSFSRYYGVTLGPLPTPTMSGYTFAGWWTAASGGTEVTSATTVTADVTYYAHWTANTYTVTFNANGGVCETTETIVEYDSGYGDLPIPFREGYTFEGWFSETEGGGKVTAETVVTGDATLYAHWSKNVQTYTVRYRKYDGSGETAKEDFECGKTYTLAWLGSELGWSRPGYEFCGWVPWNPDAKPRLCKYANGQPVKDLAAPGETIDLYCGWKSSSSYRVCFHRCAGPDDLEKMNQVILRNKDANLAWMDSQIGWKRDGYTFQGWDESDKATTVKYANGAKVKNLAMNGGTKHLYAVWRAKDDHKYSYTVKYFKYDGSGETCTQSFKAGTVQNLAWMDSQLGWSRPGYEFVGWVPWNPDAKARLCKYTNGQKVVDLASKSGETVSLYAAWKSASSYRVCLHRNDGTDVKMNQVILRNKEDNLAWMDSQICWKREGYVFKGWAESANGAVKYANGAKVKNLAMDGGTKHLYAVWKVAD